MIIKKEYIQKVSVLLPFLIVIFSDFYQISDKPFSTILKLLAAIYMVVYIVLKKMNVNLLGALLLFIPFFIYNFFQSFNINAAIEDGIRYLFPIIVIFYSYSIRHHYLLLLKFLVAFTILNDFWQLINYVNWIRGIDQWFYYRTWRKVAYYNTTAGIIRGTGLVVFFGLFGFLNAVSFFIIYKFNKSKYKNILMAITLLFLLLSFSYKTIGAFLIILFINYKNKLKLLYVFLGLLLITIVSIPKKMLSFSEDILLKISLYITEGNSARSESYRVMLNEILNFNFFGKGIGSFGGPASITYKSKLYEYYNFNWFKTIHLATTDTYYPHLFVELGIFGGLLYLLILFVPLIRKTSLKRMNIVYAIYFLLLFDALFSFSLNNLSYLMLSLAFVYAIIKYEESTFSRQHTN